MTKTRLPFTEGANRDDFIDHLIEVARQTGDKVEGYYENAGYSFVEIQGHVIWLHVEGNEYIGDLLKRMQALYDRTGYIVCSTHNDVSLKIDEPDKIKFEWGYWRGFLDALIKQRK